MGKILISLILLLIFLTCSAKTTFAAVLFEDHFNGSNADQWIPNSSSWHIQDGKYGATVNSPSTIIRSDANISISTPNYTIEYDIFLYKEMIRI